MEQANNTPGTRRKKVLFVVTKSTLGGAQHYVYDLACALPKNDYDVTVAFGGTGEPESPPGPLKDMLAGAGVSGVFLPELGRDISLAGDRAAYKALFQLFKKELPDIVHLNSSKVGGLGALAARRAGISRIIYTAHGWAFTERVSPFSRLFRFFLSWITVLLAHQVICVSESDHRAMSRAPFTRHKLIVIRNGIRTTNELARDAARNALFSPEVVRAHQKDLWVVSVAELTANKNLFKAVDAIAIVNTPHKTQNIFYTIIGDGELREALSGYCQQTKTRSAISLLGLVPESRRYLAAFDVAFLPSLKEGLPYAILEAGSAGLSVVATATGGIPEIIDSGRTGLLLKDPRSAKKIAEILKLVLDEGTRELHGRLLKKRIETDFSFERMRAQTFALYEQRASPLAPYRTTTVGVNSSRT